MAELAAPNGRRTRRRILLGAAAITLLVAVVAVVLHALSGPHAFSLVDGDVGSWAYLAVLALVAGDAVCALLPGETTLNAASTLAASGSLHLGLVMLAGSVGAIVGDSSLYWIARVGGKRFRPRVERAKQNAKVAEAMAFLGSSASTLLVFGRYVPGLRFAVNATLGLSEFPYRRFVVWSAIGGTLWSVYTCGLAYAVGTALSSFPLASVVISGAITTIAIAVFFVLARRSRRRLAAAVASPCTRS